MDKFIKINNRMIDIIECQNQRVVTLKMIDEIHQKSDGTKDKKFREKLPEDVELKKIICDLSQVVRDYYTKNFKVIDVDLAVYCTVSGLYDTYKHLEIKDQKECLKIEMLDYNKKIKACY